MGAFYLPEESPSTRSRARRVRNRPPKPGKASPEKDLGRVSQKRGENGAGDTTFTVGGRILRKSTGSLAIVFPVGSAILSSQAATATLLSVENDGIGVILLIRREWISRSTACA
jgi:hypothetical protein